MLLHIAPFLSPLSPSPETQWHRLSPAGRILCAGLGVFAIALTPNGQWLTWLVYGLVIFALVLLSQVPLKLLGKRLAVELVFVSLVILGTLFRREGDVVWQWAWLRITSQGLVIMGSVAIKVFLSLLLLNVLTLTTPISDLLLGLQVLRVPPLLIALLAAMSRYLELLVGEFQGMQRAAQSRNLLSTAATVRLVLAHTLGSLFIRTYERGERIAQAMAARGYSQPSHGKPGLLWGTNSGRARGDVLAVSLTLGIGLAGQLVHLGLGR